jgi:Mobilization protein NikA
MPRRTTKRPSALLLRFERELTPEETWASRERRRKTDRITIRVAAEEKKEMEREAALLGLGLSAYILKIHRVLIAIRAAGR